MNRREMIAISAATAAGTLLSAKHTLAAGGPVQDSASPWYRRALRWGEVLVNERDPVRYDIPWWRDYWRRTATQGLIIQASSGGAAYYPSKVPLHRPAEFLNGRDLYGELVRAAHEEGLSVLGQVYCGAAGEDMFRAHPDWFVRTLSGEPLKGNMPCINSPYYDEFIPSIMQEVIERTQPEGIFGSFWSWQGRYIICYCENCARKFSVKTGRALPNRKDWNDLGYRQWIQWNYERRTQLWDFNNRITKAAGGPNCLWVGYNSGGLARESLSFVDLREIGKRAEFLVLDCQSRDNETGFQRIGERGREMHQLMGWDRVAVENMSLYQAPESEEALAKALPLWFPEPGTSQAPPPSGVQPISFWYGAKPEPEARLYMLEGIAGGIGPVWHMFGAYHEDRRMYSTPERVLQWHKRHERYLTNRRPVAAVGIVWSQRNFDYYGRDETIELVEAPYRGFQQALIRARIPYLPIHASDVEEQAQDMVVLILPNVGALSDAECEAIRRFAGRGGAVIASGATSLYDEWGDPRPDFGLADLFGAHVLSGDFGRKSPQRIESYLRLVPELRGKAWGPKLPDDPVSGERHAVLRGFEATDSIPFGGQLEKLKVDEDAIVPLTFIALVDDPLGPEAQGLWRRHPQDDIPGLVLKVVGGASRVAYLAADLDRRYGEDNLPDHGNLLANIVRWSAGDRVGFDLRGPGLIDCHVYRQPGRAIVHLVNLTNAGTWRVPVEELIPVGPVKLRIRLPDDVRGRAVECLVSEAKPPITVREGWATVELRSILDHEVLVIS